MTDDAAIRHPIPRWVVTNGDGEPLWEPLLLASEAEAQEWLGQAYPPEDIAAGVRVRLEPEPSGEARSEALREWVRSTSQVFPVGDADAKWHRLRRPTGKHRLKTYCGKEVSADWYGFAADEPPGPICFFCDGIESRQTRSLSSLRSGMHTPEGRAGQRSGGHGRAGRD